MTYILSVHFTKQVFSLDFMEKQRKFDSRLSVGVNKISGAGYTFGDVSIGNTSDHHNFDEVVVYTSSRRYIPCR